MQARRRLLHCAFGSIPQARMLQALYIQGKEKMSSIILSLIIITIPLWACAIYVRLVLQDDLGYYFEGWQPKVALLVSTLIIVVIYLMPIFLDAQISAAISGRASRLFSLVPSVGAAMVMFPEVFTAF